jgi:hypothetical protein
MTSSTAAAPVDVSPGAALAIAYIVIHSGLPISAIHIIPAG